ncbi:MAG: ABC transporter permease [Euryarchaeota archaeon]|nr:ABC transporter permease [Euryarchaeota archaeon]MBU4339419.1 ABC transporter permease [Euryarchaeota archaeon]MBU4454123.1 ABC transporter permease [Euryarchaeota archaeon]MCG2736457.1 ABC transporter permease [Candidatus Methanoperedenaceae archaeon]
MTSTDFLINGLINAFSLIFSLNPYILSITGVSLKVSGTATLLAALTAIPLAFVLSFCNFRGRQALITLVNTGMGLPPVFVGLFIFLMLVPAGPFGQLNWIFTPWAMIIAQYIIVTPIITGISIAAIKAVPRSIIETAYTLGGDRKDTVIVTLHEAKFGIITAVLAGLGRALSEVGAILIVGGNIAYTGSVRGIGEGLSYTRTLTTAITLETSRGDISTSIALGIILITIVLFVNLLANAIQRRD